MKVIIAGPRDLFPSIEEVDKAVVASGFEVTEEVCGKAKGVDTSGENWAKANNIPVKEFYALWKKFGNQAGYVRNSDMGDYGEALIALWDGVSKGTKNMIEIAERKGLKVYVQIIR